MSEEEELWQDLRKEHPKLPYYQIQLMFLTQQQNRKRLLMGREEQENNVRLLHVPRVKYLFGEGSGFLNDQAEENATNYSDMRRVFPSGQICFPNSIQRLKPKPKRLPMHLPCTNRTMTHKDPERFRPMTFFSTTIKLSKTLYLWTQTQRQLSIPMHL